MHCHHVVNLRYHLVLCAKYRSIFKFDICEIETACYAANCSLIEFENSIDHCHLLIECPPHRSISKYVEIIKTVSSRNHKWDSTWRGWSRGYYCSTVGSRDYNNVLHYIRNQ